MCIIGVGVCWRYGRKNLKGVCVCWRVLACVSVNADEVPKNQVGVFVGKILKDVCVFSCTYACAEAAGVGGGFCATSAAI